MRPIEEACYWFSTVPGLGANGPLHGTAKADVTIIGAGFTGLWAGHFLKTLNPNLSVVIVEQGFAGYGASGRNAGIVSACLDHSHALAVTHFGQAEAARMAVLGRD